MTKREMIQNLLATYNFTADERAFFEHELELMNRKSTAPKKPTANQIANEAIKAAIVQTMVPGTLYDVATLIKTVPECTGLSISKVASLVTLLRKSGTVEQIVEKRHSYYRLAA